MVGKPFCRYRLINHGYEKTNFIISIFNTNALFSQNIDIKTLRAIQSPEAQPSDDFFKAVSNSNIYVITGVPVTMAIVGLAKHDDEILHNAAVMAAGTAVTYGIALGFTYTVKRDRPFITYPETIKLKAWNPVQRTRYPHSLITCPSRLTPSNCSIRGVFLYSSFSIDVSMMRLFFSPGNKTI